MHACGSGELLPGPLPLGLPRQDPPQLAGEVDPLQQQRWRETGFLGGGVFRWSRGSQLTLGEVGVVHKLCSIGVLNLEPLVNEFGLCLCFICEVLLGFLTKG